MRGTVCRVGHGFKLGIMIGVMLTPFGVLFNDVSRAIAIGTQAWFFLTPVIYPMPQAAWAQSIVSLNPVTPLLLTTREWMTTGQATQLSSFFWVLTTSLALMFCGWVLYRIAMPHLIARMGM